MISFHKNVFKVTIILLTVVRVIKVKKVGVVRVIKEYRNKSIHTTEARIFYCTHLFK